MDIAEVVALICAGLVLMFSLYILSGLFIGFLATQGRTRILLALNQIAVFVHYIAAAFVLYGKIDSDDQLFIVFKFWEMTRVLVIYCRLPVDLNAIKRFRKLNVSITKYRIRLAGNISLAFMAAVLIAHLLTILFRKSWFYDILSSLTLGLYLLMSLSTSLFCSVLLYFLKQLLEKAKKVFPYGRVFVLLCCIEFLSVGIVFIYCLFTSSIIKIRPLVILATGLVSLRLPIHALMILRLKKVKAGSSSDLVRLERPPVAFSHSNSNTMSKGSSMSKSAVSKDTPTIILN